MREKISRIRIIYLYLFAVLLRLVIMPITGHWDLTYTHNIAAELLSHGPQALYSSLISNYPPITIYTYALWQKIISPLVFSDFHSWLSAPLILEFSSIHALRYFFLLKLLFLPFDIAVAYFLSKLVTGENNKRLITISWLFNPLVLYTVAMWGSFDIITVFLVVLFLVLVQKRPYLLTFLVIGIAGAYKLWPLLLVPYAVVLLYRQWVKRIVASIIAFLPLILTSLPFIGNAGFRSTVLGSDQMSVIGNAGLYLGATQSLLIYFLIYCLGLLYCHRFLSGQKEILSEIMGIVLIFFYIFSYFFPQYILWVLPFMLIILVKYQPLRKNTIFLLLGYLLVILTFDSRTLQGMFSVIDPSLLDSLSLKSFLDEFYKEPTRIWNIFRTVNSAVLLWFVYEYFLLKKNETHN